MSTVPSSSFVGADSEAASDAGASGSVSEAASKCALDGLAVDADESAGAGAGVDAPDWGVEGPSEAACSDGADGGWTGPRVVDNPRGGVDKRTEGGADGDWLFILSGADELFMDSAASDTSG